MADDAAFPDCRTLADPCDRGIVPHAFVRSQGKAAPRAPGREKAHALSGNPDSLQKPQSSRTFRDPAIV